MPERVTATENAPGGDGALSRGMSSDGYPVSSITRMMISFGMSARSVLEKISRSRTICPALLIDDRIAAAFSAPRRAIRQADFEHLVSQAGQLCTRSGVGFELRN